MSRQDTTESKSMCNAHDVDTSSSRPVLRPNGGWPARGASSDPERGAGEESHQLHHRRVGLLCHRWPISDLDHCADVSY
jgi:hypothetical protein